MTISNTQNDPVESAKALLNRFLNKPLARSSRSIADRIEHWSNVANNPELYTNGDSSRHAILARRKTAIQSLKKLIDRNPAIAEQVIAERLERKEQVLK